MPSPMDLCTLAWGDHAGYVALSIRDQTKDKKERNYWRDVIYKWPDDKRKIATALEKAKESKHDVYWAPTVFETDERTQDAVTSVDNLWADLDEVDPRSLPKHLKPTAAWETSPGRFQAIWRLEQSLPAEFHRQLNQRLTYAIGADKGGWGLSKVLRIPGTKNHKYQDLPEVDLLYLNGHVLNPASLAKDLPEISGPRLVGEVDLDPQLLLRRYNRKLKARAKTLIRARHAERGVRSDRLWELECLLAEAGMKAEEIVAVVRGTVWNKFEGRNNEIPQLTSEAVKAVAHVGVDSPGEDAVLSEDDLDDVMAGPVTWRAFDQDHTPIRWMVADVWGESEVGFISGLPKSYKSWLALDLAISVATGSRFLGVFQAKKHAVLLIQEEDPKPVLQDRMTKVAAAKGLVGAEITGPDEFEMHYEIPDNLFIISNQGFSITEEWMEQLEGWITDNDIRMVILDPLMMIAGGGFDEFKAFEFMQEVLKPLKRVRARTGAAIVLVHHHIKASADSGARAMYGSVALWAWEEAALHLQVTGLGKVTAERFSKHALFSALQVTIGDVSDGWQPKVELSAGVSTLLDLLITFEGGATVDELMQATNTSRDAVVRELKRLKGLNKADDSLKQRTQGSGRPKSLWRAT